MNRTECDAKVRSILFSGPMVRAIRKGNKTMTRRVVKGRKWEKLVAEVLGTNGKWVWQTLGYDLTTPYGRPGDLLDVRENAWMFCEKRPNGKTKKGRQKWRYIPRAGAPIFYQADTSCPIMNDDPVHPETGNAWVWRLKIARFLPRWATRITIEITSIRVERVGDISGPDVVAEGIPSGNFIEFMNLWDSINSARGYSWEVNPLVWLVEFIVVEEGK